MTLRSFGSSWWTERRSPGRRLLLGACGILLLEIGLAGLAFAAEYCFGSYELRDSIPYAVQEGVWTFDSGAADSLEGWTAIHLRGPDGIDVIRLRNLSDFAGDGLPPGAPIIEGEGMIWGGVHETEAESLCYECGLGFGHDFLQGIMSPSIPRLGPILQLDFDYFMDTGESGQLDVYIIGDGGFRSYAGQVFDGPEDWNDPGHVTLEYGLPSFLDSIRVQFVLHTGPPSDRDCGYDSEFGAVGIDNVVLSGGAEATFDFEGAVEGWVTEIAGTPPGFHVHAQELSSYGQGWEEWPDCALSGHVLAFHDRPEGFSEEFREGAVSPRIDLRPLGLTDLDAARLHLDMLRDYVPLGYDPGIFWSIRVRTYPEICTVSGGPIWSDWRSVYSTHLTDAECEGLDVDLLPGIEGIPEEIQVMVEVFVCPACCPIPCDEERNQSPLFDNLQVCVSRSPATDVPDGGGGGPLQEQPALLSIRVSPNPMAPESILELVVQQPTRVQVTLHDGTGRRIGSLFAGNLPRGRTEVPLGERLMRLDPGVAKGVLFVRVEAPGFERTEKLVLVP